MDSVEFLLCRGTPRGNIPNVEKWNELLPCDKYHVKYMNEYKAYKEMRHFFLKHDYDYMVLATDDIEVRPEHIKQLQADLDCIRYPVLGGMMNVDQDDIDRFNICFDIGMVDRKLREYHWLRKDQMPKDPLFPVVFNGFSLMAIRRDIIEDYVFATDGIFRGTGVQFGASLDFVFCHYCKENKIPIMTDQRINMKHWRSSGEMMVGKKQEVLLFQPYYLDKEKISLGHLKDMYKKYKETGGSGSQDMNDLIDALYQWVVK